MCQFNVGDFLCMSRIWIFEYALYTKLNPSFNHAVEVVEEVMVVAEIGAGTTTGMVGVLALIGTSTVDHAHGHIKDAWLCFTATINLYEKFSVPNHQVVGQKWCLKVGCP